LKTSPSHTPREKILLSLNLQTANKIQTFRDDLLLALELFDGEPMYGSRKDDLPLLLMNPDFGKKNAIELVSMRGKGHLLDKSDLDFFDTD
jgi:hypothetical protein